MNNLIYGNVLFYKSDSCMIALASRLSPVHVDSHSIKNYITYLLR